MPVSPALVQARSGRSAGQKPGLSGLHTLPPESLSDLTCYKQPMSVTVWSPARHCHTARPSTTRGSSPPPSDGQKGHTVHSSSTTCLRRLSDDLADRLGLADREDGRCLIAPVVRRRDQAIVELDNPDHRVERRGVPDVGLYERGRATASSCSRSRHAAPSTSRGTAAPTLRRNNCGAVVGMVTREAPAESWYRPAR
jgi:hypothetical protein